MKRWIELFLYHADDFINYGIVEDGKEARKAGVKIAKLTKAFRKLSVNYNFKNSVNKMKDLEREEEKRIRQEEKDRIREELENNRKVEIYDVPPTTDELDDPFKMEIDQAYWVEAKKGYLLTGKIVGGFIDIDDKIILSNGLKATVKEFDNESDYACAFDTNVGILVSGIKKGALDGVEGLTAEIKW